MTSNNSFNTLTNWSTTAKEKYFALNNLILSTKTDFNRLPYSLKVLLENALRFEDGRINNKYTIEGFAKWLANGGNSNVEIGFMPARVLMQDFTGVPAVVDLAAMRGALAKLGGDAKKINPLIPVDLVIDHSVQVDKYASSSAFEQNVAIEMQRNIQRYEFLRWGAKAFNNFRVVPPGTGICHQINIEYLASVVQNSNSLIYPDTLVGTDSHTTMVNALGVLGWGVGGIEAEAAMLGQPLSMLIPEVVGIKLFGNLKAHVNSTDLVLHITNMLRKVGVVGKFVEFYGPALQNLPIADRATIANMAPEYGATCGFFPVDQQTIKYLELTNRSLDHINMVWQYCQIQGLIYQEDQDKVYSQYLSLDLAEVESCISGPKRPQDIIKLPDVKANFINNITHEVKEVKVANYSLQHGSIVIAAITSCTNTSNPEAMIGAALVAKNILAKGCKLKPWVKTSFAPGSQVVTSYLQDADLQTYLDQLGFNLVGYGCTTCIGNSGPLLEEIEQAIVENNLQVASVLSGNRNFEGRIHPLVKANYLASPMLVVAYSLAGRVGIDIENDPISVDQSGNNVYLKDIWPSKEQIQQLVAKFVTPNAFAQKYNNVFSGSKHWQELQTLQSTTYHWPESTYIKHPPYFEDISLQPEELKQIKNASIIAVFGDSITTDHISPAGSIAKNSPAAKYLMSQGLQVQDFNSYGARRGNHEVMMRGTFANSRIKNELCSGIDGGLTKSMDGSVKSIYDAAMEYKNHGISLVVIAGQEYGTGSSRDWAAKGTALLGIKAVIAQSFERIHRSNLIGMGVLPLKFKDGITRLDLKLTGAEKIDILFDPNQLKPYQEFTCIIDGKRQILLEGQIFTDIEIEYLKHGTILHKVIRSQIN